MSVDRTKHFQFLIYDLKKIHIFKFSSRVHNNIRCNFYLVFRTISSFFFRIKIGQRKLTLILSKLKVFWAKIDGSSGAP